MKRFSDVITVAAFFTILIMFAVSTLFFQGSVTVEQIKESELSPKQAVNEYVDRNFPMDSNWKTMYTNLMLGSGRTRFRNVMYTDGRLIKLSDNKSNNNTIENIAHINELAVNTDKPIYMMLAPTSAGVYSADIPEMITGVSQREMINNAYMQLDKRIVSLDAFYPLYSAREEYVYYRTENLWTSFGAYYAYSETVGQLGFQPVTLDNYDQEYALSSFCGSLYNDASVSSISPDRINIFRSKYQSPVTNVALHSLNDDKEAESVYFRSALKSDKKTDIFLLGDRYITADITTDRDTAPKLLIIKGSFANSIAPFYTPHYSKITLVDPARLEDADMTLSDAVNIEDYDQILVLFDIDSFSSARYFDTLK